MISTVSEMTKVLLLIANRWQAAERPAPPLYGRVIGLCLVLLARTPIGLATELALQAESKVRLASVKEGRDLLGQPDRFVRRLSRFDRQSRLQARAPVSQEQYLDFVTQQVLGWQAAEKTKLRTALKSIRDRLVPFELNFPQTVLLIKTTGREEGGAAYCRQHAVILPRPAVRRSGRQLERLLLHELFHILSSHNPQLRTQLYQIVGFTTCPEINYPPVLRSRRITNPDSPLVDCYIELQDPGTQVHAAPILFASVDQYDAKRGGTMFQYLQFRLMAVESSGGKWQFRLRDGQPVLLQPRQSPSFMRQIGENTNYIIHPDEILADNFVLLTTAADAVPTPRILTQMRQLLAK